MLSPNGDRVTREYDGNGCGDVLDFDSCKMVLADAYNDETFAELGESEYEPGQGVFHSRGLINVLKDLPALPSFAVYNGLRNRYEKEEEGVRDALLRERGIACDGELGARVAAALEDLAAGWEREFETLLERSPDIQALLPTGFDNLKKLAQLFDEQLVLRTTATARSLLQQVLS